MSDTPKRTPYKDLRRPAQTVPLIEPIERPTALRYVIGANEVFVGTLFKDDFPKEFLENLINDWQKKLKQKPATFFINLNGERGPQVEKALNIAGAAINQMNADDESKMPSKILLNEKIGPLNFANSSSVAIHDQQAEIVACAINVNPYSNPEAELASFIGVSPSSIKKTPFTSETFLRMHLTHELGHCGTAHDKNGLLKDNLMAEVIADRFLSERLDEHPKDYPGLTREHIRQMRMAEGFNKTLANFPNGKRIDAHHLTSFGLEKNYKNIQDASTFDDGYTERQDRQLAGIIDTVARSTPKEKLPEVSNQEIFAFAQRMKQKLKLDPSNFREYRRLKDETDSYTRRFFGPNNNEDKAVAEGYEQAMQAFMKDGQIPENHLNGPAKDMISRFMNFISYETANHKMKESFYDGLPSFAHGIQKLRQEGAFEKNSMEWKMTGLYLDAVKTFSPQWLEEPAAPAAKPANAPKPD